MPDWRPKIEALIDHAPRHEAIAGLHKILAHYGKVTSIDLLQSAPDTYLFLIDFENPEDAISASFELNYLLFGHSTLVIHAPCPGNSRK